MARRKKRRQQLSGFGLDKGQVGARMLCVGSSVAGGIAGKVASDILFEKTKFMTEEVESKDAAGTSIVTRVPKKGKDYVVNGGIMLLGAALSAFSREPYLQHIGAGIATAGAIEMAEGIKGENNDSILSGFYDDEDGMGAIEGKAQFMYIADANREQIVGQEFNDNVPGSVKFKKKLFIDDKPGAIAFQADKRAAK